MMVKVFFTLEKWEVGFKWTCTSRWIGQNHDSIENFYKTSICPASSSHPTQIRFLHRKKTKQGWISIQNRDKSFVVCHVYLSNYSGMPNSILPPMQTINKIVDKKQHLNVTMIDSLIGFSKGKVFSIVQLKCICQWAIYNRKLPSLIIDLLFMAAARQFIEDASELQFKLASID